MYVNQIQVQKNQDQHSIVLLMQQRNDKNQILFRHIQRAYQCRVNLPPQLRAKCLEVLHGLSPTLDKS